MKNCVSPRSVDNQELVKFRGNAKSWMQMLEGWWWWVVFLCGVFTLQSPRRETVAGALALKNNRRTDPDFSDLSGERNL